MTNEEIFEILAARSVGPVVDESGCWLWQGYLNPKGYAYTSFPGIKMIAVHRWVAQQIHGDLKYEEKVDHICEVKHCCNPDHLQIATNHDNIVRSREKLGSFQRNKSHCVNGHPYSDENTLRIKGKKGIERRCRTCNNEKQNQRRAKKRLAQ